MLDSNWVWYSWFWLETQTQNFWVLILSPGTLTCGATWDLDSRRWGPRAGTMGPWLKSKNLSSGVYPKYEIWTIEKNWWTISLTLHLCLIAFCISRFRWQGSSRSKPTQLCVNTQHADIFKCIRKLCIYKVLKLIRRACFVNHPPNQPQWSLAQLLIIHLIFLPEINNDEINHLSKFLLLEMWAKMCDCYMCNSKFPTYLVSLIFLAILAITMNHMLAFWGNSDIWCGTGGEGSLVVQ